MVMRMNRLPLAAELCEIHQNLRRGMACHAIKTTGIFPAQGIRAAMSPVEKSRRTAL